MAGNEARKGKQGRSRGSTIFGLLLIVGSLVFAYVLGRAYNGDSPPMVTLGKVASFSGDFLEGLAIGVGLVGGFGFLRRGALRGRSARQLAEMQQSVVTGLSTLTQQVAQLQTEVGTLLKKFK